MFEFIFKAFLAKILKHSLKQNSSFGNVSKRVFEQKKQ